METYFQSTRCGPGVHSSALVGLVTSLDGSTYTGLVEVIDPQILPMANHRSMKPPGGSSRADVLLSPKTNIQVGC